MAIRDDTNRLNELVLNQAKYFIELTKASQENQKDNFIAAYLGIERLCQTNFETIKNFIAPSHGITKGNKRPSLKNAFDELAFNFCQVCLQFQCITHQSPNMDNNWAF